jgi:hypothetical protein
MKLFYACIVSGLLLMGVGLAIALPTENMARIWIGAAFVWLALPCFWLASQVQPR